MALDSGDTIGQYEIVKEIGEGGMAVVYHARHAVLHSDHAIKILHERFIRHEEIRQRFLEEGRIQAQLRHPHIVPVTDILAEPGVAGLVMPLMHGGDLDDLLHRDGAVSVDDAVEWTAQVLLALSHVHQRGIIHRDLKPSNIFIEDHPRERVVRVMDFGIAKVLDRSRTRTAAVMGTPAYMSPEQIRSPAHVDTRTDLFAVGSLLYEMLTGTPAFDGDTEFDIQSQIVTGQFTPLRQRRQELPPHLDAIVQKALAVDPDERFASAADFLKALDGTVVVQPPERQATRQTLPPLPPSETTQPPLPNKTLPPLLPAGIAQSPPPPPPTTAQPPTAQPPEPQVPAPVPRQSPKKKKQKTRKRPPIEFGVFGIGRKNRLFIGALGMLTGSLAALQFPEVPLAPALLLGGVVGYWLFEWGCLALLIAIVVLTIGAILEASGIQL